MIWPSCFGDKKLFWIFPLHTGPTIISGFFLCTYFHHSLFAPRSRRASDSDPYLWPSDGAVYTPDTPGSQHCIRISGEGPDFDIPATITRSCASGRTGGILCQLCWGKEAQKIIDFVIALQLLAFFFFSLEKHIVYLSELDVVGLAGKKRCVLECPPPFSDRTTNKGKHPNNNLDHRSMAVNFVKVSSFRQEKYSLTWNIMLTRRKSNSRTRY